MSITESYFGAEIIPLEITNSEYGKIYVGKALNNKIVLYDENGQDSMSLSEIDTDDFEEELKGIKNK